MGVQTRRYGAAGARTATIVTSGFSELQDEESQRLAVELGNGVVERAGLRDREIGGHEDHPHEKLLGFDIVELLGVEDVAALLEQETGDAVDDAGTVRACATGPSSSTSMIWCTGRLNCLSGLGATSTGQLSEPTRMGSCFASHSAAR